MSPLRNGFRCEPQHGDSVAQAFADEGLDGLWDIAAGRGRKPKYQIDKIAAIVDATATNQTGGDDALGVAGPWRRARA